MIEHNEMVICTDEEAPASVSCTTTGGLGQVGLPGPNNCPDHVRMARRPEPNQDEATLDADLDPAQDSVQKLLFDITQPITPGLVTLERSIHTPPSRPRRKTETKDATATRRSHRLQDRKKEVIGGGSTTMQLARKLIISKKGLAIAERGEELEDDVLCKYKAAFDDPLSPAQLEALTTLAKGACRKNKTGAAASTTATGVLVMPAK
jgi:hypothetical protein